jgi:hypothetical protein
MKNSRGSEGFLLRKSRFYSASEASGQSQNTGIQKNIPTKGFFSFPLMAALSPFLLSKIRTYFFFLKTAFSSRKMTKLYKEEQK